MKSFNIIKMLLLGTIIISLLIILIIYVAYYYEPQENRAYNSPYLESINDKYIELSDFTAHYIVKGSGTPIILIHGGGSWLYSYRNNINELSKYYKVYAIDMPGHGYTKEKTKATYNLDTYADFIKEFMEKQNIECAKIVGHSWGGGWAIYYAEKYPEMVEKLVLLDSSGLNERDESEWKYLSYPIIGEIVSKLISKNNTKSSLKKMFINQNILTSTYINEIYTPLSFEENRNAQVKAQRHLDWQITERLMGQIQKPVLLIFGAEDCYFNEEYREKMNKKLPHSELNIIERTSHIPHEEQYKYVDNLMLNFFAKNNMQNR